jgi:hypothetical protein
MMNCLALAFSLASLALSAAAYVRSKPATPAPTTGTRGLGGGGR